MQVTPNAIQRSRCLCCGADDYVTKPIHDPGYRRGVGVARRAPSGQG